MAKLKERYANALIKISEDNSSFERDLEHAVLICDMLDNAEVQAFILHPHVTDKQKYQLFDSAFSDNVANHLMGFLYLMVHKNRESLIVTTLTEYIERLNKKLGKIMAKVVSATELTEKQIEAIRIILSKQTGIQVQINAVVDPDVIGGFYILIDGYIFDGTVRSELNMMKERLKRGSYEW